MGSLYPFGLDPRLLGARNDRASRLGLLPNTWLTSPSAFRAQRQAVLRALVPIRRQCCFPTLLRNLRALFRLPLLPRFGYLQALCALALTASNVGVTFSISRSCPPPMALRSLFPGSQSASLHLCARPHFESVSVAAIGFHSLNTKRCRVACPARISLSPALLRTLRDSPEALLLGAIVPGHFMRYCCSPECPLSP